MSCSDCRHCQHKPRVTVYKSRIWPNEEGKMTLMLLCLIWWICCRSNENVEWYLLFKYCNQIHFLPMMYMCDIWDSVATLNCKLLNLHFYSRQKTLTCSIWLVWLVLLYTVLQISLFDMPQAGPKTLFLQEVNEWYALYLLVQEAACPLSMCNLSFKRLAEELVSEPVQVRTAGKGKYSACTCHVPFMRTLYLCRKMSLLPFHVFRHLGFIPPGAVLFA